MKWWRSQKKPNETASDQELISLFCQTENQEALAILFDRYLPLIYGVCVKYLRDREQAKDVSIEVYDLMQQKLAQQEIMHFKSWLYIVTRNQCLMKLREIKKMPITPMESNSEVHLISEDAQTLEQTMLHDDAALSYCMDQLNAQQRSVIELFYLQEKSYAEVAELTGFDLMQVKSYIQNGKRNLKMCIEKRRLRS